jgi:hypothetical protein
MVGVGEQFDTGDQAVDDREGEDDPWLPADGPDSSGDAVHQSQLRGLAPPGEGLGHGRPAMDSVVAPIATAAGSARSTTSGSSIESSASKSPPREAARKASTTSRWRLRSVPGIAGEPWTRRRARLASCLAAAGERPTMGASSNCAASQSFSFIGHIPWSRPVVPVTS